MKNRIILSLTLATLLAAKISSTENEKIFRISPALDIPLATSALALCGTTFALDKFTDFNKPDLESAQFEKSGINAFDRIFVNPYSKTLDTAGTVLSAAACISPAILAFAPKNQWLEIGTMYAETMLFAWGFKELGKLCVNRARPYMYFDGAPQEEIEDGDWANSFFSGHTTLAFAAATYTSYVFGKLMPDSAFKIPVIAGTYTLAAAVAVTRIAGGCHFTTDVLVGALVGSACGFLVPFIHSKIAPQKKNEKMEVAVNPLGVQFLIRL
ncbi:MAG: phosphatase PAP2 family protein [Spirochaetales bacterium]|nr:phosphatase PAP2 family protein [Spirochaetales bacterium]